MLLAALQRDSKINGLVVIYIKGLDVRSHCSKLRDEDRVLVRVNLPSTCFYPEESEET